MGADSRDRTLTLRGEEEDPMKPVIDEDNCIQCGICVETCEHAVLETVDGETKVVAPGNCEGDGACVDVCPNEAIAIVSA